MKRWRSGIVFIQGGGLFGKGDGIEGVLDCIRRIDREMHWIGQRSRGYPFHSCAYHH